MLKLASTFVVALFALPLLAPPAIALQTIDSPQSLTEAEGRISADWEVAAVIDEQISMSLQNAGLTAAPPALPETLLRRTTLDLAGRIPTTTELDWYLSEPESTRQVQLVNRLFSLSDTDFHLRNCLDELLLPNRPYDGTFREYLLWAVQTRRPWNEMFRDMLLAKLTDGPEKGAAQFLRSRVRELDDLTNDTSILFFGVNVSCAKCHDHPLVADWKQSHFYGMQAFFHRTYATRKEVLAEKAFGDIRFKTTSGEEHPAPLMFLTGMTIEDRTPELSDDEKKTLDEQVQKLQREDEAGEIPVPAFSPREALVEAALADQDAQFLARNIVNRTWARLLGTGIVNPPDQMHSGNPASHPLLLQRLAEDFRQSGYDLRHLIRGIVLSKAYARTSVWEADSERPPVQAFAVVQPRALTPRQLALSLFIAAANPQTWPAIENSDEWNRKRTDLENQADGLSREFERPSEYFQIAVDEALFFSNNDRISNDLLRTGDDRLVGYLARQPNAEELASSLWKCVLNRSPTTEEQQMAVEWLQRPDQDRTETIRHLCWALLAGSELRFNY